MKSILILMTVFVFCSSACEKENGDELKQELNILIHNESNNSYNNSRIVAFAANNTPSDSLSIDVDQNSEQIYKWKPKLSSPVGTIYFYLTDTIYEQILYYDGYSVLANQTDYKITISIDSVINIE